MLTTLPPSLPTPQRGNRLGWAACLTAVLTLAWAAVEGLDNAYYTAWLREHVHWFTPLLPTVLLAVAIKRRAAKGLVALTLLLVLLQYGLLYTLYQIGQAGAAVWQQL